MKYLTGSSIHKDFSVIEEVSRSIYGKPYEVLFAFDAASHFNMSFNKAEIEDAKKLRNAYKGMFDGYRWVFWQSWALSDYPGAGLQFLKDSEWLDLFPEIFVNIGALQNPKTHPEGDVFNHLVLAVDVAAGVANREDLSEEDRIVLVFAALCHDFGKYMSHKNHEKLGVGPTETFLKSIGAPYNVIDKVKKLVEFHGSDYQFLGEKVTLLTIDESFVERLETHLIPATIPLLVFLNEADVNGRLDENGKVLNNSYDKRISEGNRKILSIYEKKNRHGFSEGSIVNMVNAGILDIDDVKPGFSQFTFIHKMNQLISEGYVNSDEAETVAGYVFSSSYRDGLDYCETLDYRSKKFLVDYMNDNNVDLDTLLLKGKIGIEQILNHSDL